jgi:hypothetical protein
LETEKDALIYRVLALLTGRKAVFTPDELVVEPVGRHLRWRADAAVAGLPPQRRGGTTGAWNGRLTEGTEEPSAAMLGTGTE